MPSLCPVQNEPSNTVESADTADFSDQTDPSLEDSDGEGTVSL